MRVTTSQLFRISCMVAIIGTILQAPIPAANLVHAANGEGEIEFRRAEGAHTPRPKVTDFVTEEFRGVQYRVAKSAELKFGRAELTEVIVQETEPGQYGLQLVVDRSLWTAIKSITTASLGGRLAILVDGSLIFVGTVLEPLSDGRVFMSFDGRSKEEVFEIARRFSNTPRFLPLEGTSIN
ncbi:MAG: hypothetical protein ACE5JU_08055 [Candidatus Binatia bacterium]